MTTNVSQIYEQLAVRINYPITPTYRCLMKVIGFINILMTYTNTPQILSEVSLQGEPGHRTYTGTTKLSYLDNGEPIVINPDGTIRTNATKGYAIHKYLWLNSETEEEKQFVDNQSDVIVSDEYVQPLLTALYLMFQGINPAEAVLYINSACTTDEYEANMSNVDLKHIKRRL